MSGSGVAIAILCALALSCGRRPFPPDADSPDAALDAGAIDSGGSDGGIDAGALDAGGISLDGGDGGMDAGAPDAGAFICPPEAAWGADGLLSCNAQVGLTGPLPVCSSAFPCQGNVTQSQIDAECYTHVSTRPSFDDRPERRWNDAVTGEPRQACAFVPVTASASSPRPLVVYLHGSKAYAGRYLDNTSLRSKAGSFDLSGDPSRPGFAIASPQALAVHWPHYAQVDGSHEDIFFRDFGSPSCNRDIRNLDSLIDSLVATGKIDGKRIYLMGHSNGATFAHLYGVARHQRATPGGNRVAAVATYAGYDPFENVFDGQTPSCRLSPYPKTTVPLMMVHRACDAFAACNEAQRVAFGLPPGDDAVKWMTQTLPVIMGDSVTSEVILDGDGFRVFNCSPAAWCTALKGTMNHLAWPDGLNDGSGKDWELEMLSFLRSHPLP